MKKQWWHNKVAYQIYPKSFYDTNGDGIGDLKGITAKLDYLKELGVDILWICPIFASPMVDQGYDISDYYSINPCFGTMEDFDELLEETKKRDMHILMDLVVNHCSDQHEWFQKAMKDPEGEYAKYFYIMDGNDGNPPNNWRAEFGGSCWERVPGYENKFYFHTFAKEQPDLNWENRAVREEVYKMVNWWLEKGISGFRIDAIINIKKDLTWESLPPDCEDGTVCVFETNKRAHGIGEFLGELRDRCFQPHNALTVGEVFNTTPEQLEEFIGEDGYFSTMFEFEHCLTTYTGAHWCDNSPFEFKKWRNVVLNNQVYINDLAFEANIIENHDQSRGVSYFIPEEDYSFESVTALATVMLLLKGIPFLYQGQEIGMRNCRFDSAEMYEDISTLEQYKQAVLKGHNTQSALDVCYQYSRDNARTPMQWSGEKNAGFTTGTPWFHVNPNYKEINVKADLSSPKSVFRFYRELIALRKKPEYEDILIEGNTNPIYMEEDFVFAYERISANRNEKIIVISNYQNAKFKLRFEHAFEDVLLNNYDSLEYENGFLFLEPYQTIVLKLVAKKGDTYWDALTKNVYNPIDIEYDDVPSKQYDENGHPVNVEGDDGQWINISIGTLDEAYWSAYYEFEKLDDVWVYIKAETTFEYEGLIIYGKTNHFESGDSMNWRWIDEKAKVCWSVNVPLDKGLDSVDIVKEIIDLNK